MTRRQVLTEIVLIFAVFFVQGAVPVPDVNEPYYLGKAIHFWNPDWVQGDFFLDSADTHSVFYFTFGWLSLLLPPAVLARTGRLLTWGLLAWAWRRLSTAVVPRPWCSVLSAALMVCLVEHFNMAGEWIVGGVEAKGFSYVLVLLGVEAIVRDRWNRAWLFLGAATAFHVIVGGWSVVAAGIAWLVLGKDRPALRSMAPALFGGLVLALPGLIPSLLLNLGTDAETIRSANQVYVYERLAHHLSITQMPGRYIFRFVLLLAIWIVLCLRTPEDKTLCRLQAFVTGSLAIMLLGIAITPLACFDRPLCASLLRFYWFRLSDVAVPLGVAIGTVSFIQHLGWKRRVFWSAVAIVVASVHVGVHAVERAIPTPPRADRLPDYVAWRQACDWVASSVEIPPDARFITPRMAQTFKWYAGRPEVGNWKEIPQDAITMVQWWRRMCDMHSTGSEVPWQRWHVSLAELGAMRLRQLGAEYDADYVITFARPRLPLKAVYENRTYIIYQIPNPMPHPRAVIFDMDGLIFDTENIYTMAGTELLRRRGHPFPDELKNEMMGLQPRSAFEKMIRWHGLNEPWEELATESNGLFVDMLDEHLATMPGVFELLDALEAADIPKAIGTSSPRELADECLSPFDLQRRFAFILTAEDVSYGKPDPEIYLTAAARFGLPAEQTLVLEDSRNGCLAAVAAGAFTVAVPSEHSSTHDFSAASLVIDGLSDARLYEVLGINR